MNKNELANKIRRIDGLTNGEKSALIELLRKQKKYGLVWEDKPEDVEERLREELPVLIEDTGKAIISEEADAPNHILIEGDNLEALTALAYTHEGQIDIIYIDPPYNTGNKDFVYNDQFVDKEDSYRHSKWLSFMAKRLRIAKQLLSDKGVIFISIDDNEQAQLKLLCDEIFGEKNFVSKFDWRKKTGANDAKDIAVITESIFLYAKNHSLTILDNIWARDEMSVNKNRYKLSDEYVGERGMYYLDTLDRGGLQYSDSMNFGIEAPDGGIIYPNGRSEFVNDGWIWKWGKEKVKWGIENKFLEFVKSKKSQGSKYTIKYKVYQFVDNEGNIRERSGRAFTNLITDPINQQGNIDITNIFDGLAVFSNPKPIGLIQYLLKILRNKSFTIFDFFAGSGTTLHATMQLNAEDGGHRKCILVTNNENNICEAVTYERNKRVIQGYTTPKGEEVPGLKGNTLRYYKTEFISRDQTPRNMRALVAASTDLLCIKNDIYKEGKLAGRDINPKIARYFEEGDRRMLVIYDERAIPAIAEILETTEPGKEKIKVYLFSPSSYAYDDEFVEVSDKIQLCALPDAIYQAYRKVLPKRRPKFLPEAMEEARQSKADENGIFHFTDGEAEV
ncbi:site-specific DNA-methyltransferase [Coprobacter fastidiosus]|jgi:adenine-specific DNA-methyltransferase|uniref:site-specific DNA-methyltransferase n=1 Tax=Coprobacter fastidiosus TaxID=1099853 RepID=UPI00266FA5C2|nr:DNA methyltransferase [Coprobacter fastidiosus]